MGTQINLPYSYGSSSNYKTFQTNGGYNVRAFWTAEEVSHTNNDATVVFTLNMYYSSSKALWTNQSNLQFSVEALDPDTGESLAHSGNINMPNLPASSNYTTYQATLVIPRRADGTIKFKPKFWFSLSSPYQWTRVAARSLALARLRCWSSSSAFASLRPRLGSLASLARQMRT